MKTYHEFAKYYDLIYSQKTYEKECDFLENIFRKNKVKNVLDVCCGTGTHAIILTKRGYALTGIDISGEMLKIAKEKCEKEKLKIRFYRQDMRNINLKENFDAAICMFTSFNHILTEGDARQTLFSIKNLLKRNGVLILDLLNPEYLSQLTQFPPQIRKLEDGKIIRSVRIENYPEILRAKWHFSYLIREKDKVITESESINLKFYRKEEIIKILTTCGFKISDVYGDFTLKEKLNNKSKRMILVAKKGFK